MTSRPTAGYGADGGEPGHEAARAQPADPRLHSLRNARVSDAEGRKLGKIDDIYVSDRDQQVTWVSVSLGFLRTAEVLVPIDLLFTREGVVSVDAPRAVIEDAPRARVSGHLSAADESEVRAYYARAFAATPAA